MSLFRSRTSLNIIVNTIGSYLSVGFSVVFTTILARIMDPESYGSLAVLIGVIYSLSNILDFGTTANIYARLPDLHASRDRRGLYTFVKSLIYYQTIGVSLLIGALLIAMSTLDRYVLHTDQPYYVLAITAISIYGFVLQNTLQNMLFATKDFVFVNIWLNIGNIIRLVLLGVLYQTDNISILSMLLLLGLTAPLTLLVPIAYRYRAHLTAIARAPALRSEYRFSYVMTNFLAQQAFGLGMRMDLFIISSYKELLGLAIPLGNYALAQKIILSIISVVVSITQVLSPEFSTIDSARALRRVLRHAGTYLLIPTAIFALLSVTPRVLFDIIFTPKFALVAEYSHILGMAYVLFGLGQIPALLILYTYRKPIHLLWTNVLFLIVTVPAIWWSIPRYGVSAAPVALGITLTTLIATQGAVAWRLSREKNYL